MGTDVSSYFSTAPKTFSPRSSSRKICSMDSIESASSATSIGGPGLRTCSAYPSQQGTRQSPVPQDQEVQLMPNRFSQKTLCNGAATHDQSHDNFTPRPVCPHCQELEKDVLLLQKDVEYLRSLVISQEYDSMSVASNSARSVRSTRDVYTSNGNSVVSSRPYPLHAHSAGASKDASPRLVDVTVRHKRQVEQISRERVSYRHNDDIYASFRFILRHCV